MNRAPVQSSGHAWLLVGHKERAPDAKPAGTISWAEHVEAWTAYSARYGHEQSAERIAERGGFDYYELREYLGREPTTWSAR